MNYGTLIRDAWATTWRFRYLWVLGLLAGVTGGTMSLGRYSMQGAPSSDTVEFGPRLGLLAVQSAGWIESSLPIVVTLAFAATLAGVLLAGLSVIARGGITQATVDIELGQASSLVGAWRAGTRWFWRFLGLLVLLGVLVAAVAGAAVLAALNLGTAGALLAAVALTLGVVASIVLAYAERAIVIHDLGPLAALAYGWHLFRQHLSASLLAWVLSVALSAGVGVAAAVGVGTVLMLFGGIGVAVWAIGGFGAPLILDAAVALVAALALLVLMAAIANTFFWSYWTLAYMRLDNSNGQPATA
jgi:hypothetical protein